MARRVCARFVALPEPSGWRAEGAEKDGTEGADLERLAAGAA
jgi:hypothetical protein